MKKTHKHHSHSTKHVSKKHHHSHHSEPKVDLDNELVRMDGQTYLWKNAPEKSWREPSKKWYRISTKHCKRDGKEVPFVNDKRRVEINRSFFGDHGYDIEWEDVLRPIYDSDSSPIKKLNHLVEHAEHEKERLKKKLNKIAKHERKKAKKAARETTRLEIAERQRIKELQKGLGLRGESDSASDSNSERVESDSTEADDTKKKKHPADAPGEDKRTKRGVKLFSNGGKYHFSIQVNKSTKYRGHANIRLMVAGQWKMYTLDAASMKLLREEVARGGN